ncbi:putative pyrroloquinoline-quinone binding quinoprotein [Isoptericola jiangsuensis]|uniref:Putative pyrroloquinoline-quinone binding quinoprotein n=1 Tax=Isoptericola jiangsuensis TaxID=548579 RepID=A0A2A9EZZ6_9MICO|nr:PQQ-binding-like beta-propeller repeat protein [Isoptericola jiangsuensis]PFG44727.1 putative pyrroloquinoline-quinone binding quinoprotein [Isoptericola jiangsuensis]
MGRRRRPEGAFTFDLVPDEGEVATPDAPAGATLDDDAGTRRGRVGRAWRGTHRHTRWGVLVAVVALAGTGVVVDAAMDRGREAALREAAGGVVDLSLPPREVWRVDGVADERAVPGGLAAVTGDVVAVQRAAELLGVDLETGETRWSVALVDRPGTCGPGLTFWSDTAEVTRSSRVVCLGQDRAGATTVLVVEEDGTVLARRELSEPVDLAVPGPGASVMTARWVGSPDDVDVQLQGDPMTDLAVVGDIDDGYDLQVRLEDAVTGEVRWTRTVPFGEVLDEEQCVRWSTGGRTAELERRGAVEHAVSERLVGVSGCGILAYFTPDGDPLDLSVLADADTESVRQVRPLADGGYAVSTGGWGQSGWRHHVLDGQGRLRFVVVGRLLDPWATSGVAADRWLVGQDGVTVALDATGAEVWRTRVGARELLARTSGVAVVLDDRDRVLGLDLADGSVLWVRDDVATEPATSGGEDQRTGEIQSVFTDGTVVATVAPAYTDAAVVSVWRALDVSTGEDLWSVDLRQDGWGVDLAVDGHLLRWWPTGLAGLSP